jgi:hypothetical protein
MIFVKHVSLICLNMCKSIAVNTRLCSWFTSIANNITLTNWARLHHMAVEMCSEKMPFVRASRMSVLYDSKYNAHQYRVKGTRQWGYLSSCKYFFRSAPSVAALDSAITEKRRTGVCGSSWIKQCYLHIVAKKKISLCGKCKFCQFHLTVRTTVGSLRFNRKTKRAIKTKHITPL